MKVRLEVSRWKVQARYLVKQENKKHMNPTWRFMGSYKPTPRTPEGDLAELSVAFFYPEKASYGASSANIMTTSEEQFHEELVAMVSQGQRDDGSVAWQWRASDPNAPPPRSNHTTSLHENSVVLFGGHGGVGYQRKPFNDTWVLNLDNQPRGLSKWVVRRWTELACHGNPPPPRSGHQAFAKDGCVYIFGGWNNEQQFNDLFMLDIENKDMGEPMRWSDPTLDMKGEDAHPPPREHSAICYDPEESRLVIFGGWANKWLDDVWQINVSSIVGPPYAITKVEPPLGPVTGNMKVTVHLVIIEFSSGKLTATTQGNVINDEASQWNLQSNSITIIVVIIIIIIIIVIIIIVVIITIIIIIIITIIIIINIVISISRIRIIRIIIITTITIVIIIIIIIIIITIIIIIIIIIVIIIIIIIIIFIFIFIITIIIDRHYTYFLNSIAEKSLCFGPGVLQEQQANMETRFMIQEVFRDVCFELNDLNDGKTEAMGPSEVKYMADEGENNKPRPIRGSPFRPTLTKPHVYTKMARNRANEYSGQKSEVLKRYSGPFFITPDMYDQEDTLILRQDEIVETLSQLEREGLPSDKQMKQLKKIGANLTQLKQDIVAKEKEIQPMVQKESDFYKKAMLRRHGAIADFENELKTYQGGLKKEAYYFYKSKGLWEFEVQRIKITEGFLVVRWGKAGFEEMFEFREVVAGDMEDLLHIATNFNYPEVQRIKITEGFLVVRWGKAGFEEMFEFREVVAGDMEAFKAALHGRTGLATGLAQQVRQTIQKSKLGNALLACDMCGSKPILGKNSFPTITASRGSTPGAYYLPHLCRLKEVKVDRKCDAFMGVQDILLRDMWNLELHKNPDFVEDTADQEWAEVDFQFESHRGTEVMLMKNIAEVSQLLSEVQRSWVFLENLFIFSDEVKKELPEESDKFVGIDMDVKEILMNGFQVKSTKDFCNQGNIFQKLEKVQGALEMCQKALNEFMVTSRPRFPKFFIAIDSYTLEFPDGEDNRPHAVGMSACVGKEYVPFPEPLPLLGKVESYLDKCIEWFQKALKFFAKQDKEKYFSEGCMEDGTKRGEFIAKSQAAQCALLVQLITWVMLVETGPFLDGKEEAVKEAWEESHRLLLSLIEKTMTNLDKPTRQKIMCAITLDAHNRDVQERHDLRFRQIPGLVNEKVNTKDAFQWQSMLKCYWKEDVDDASMEIADAKLPYGYEYLGNGPRLVVTPLTDRIYVTATQALPFCLLELLVEADIQKACYVINAAPEMDYLTLGDIYKGLLNKPSEQKSLEALLVKA
ncbi:Dynein alpha chain, flagellar outer arm [Symbiodinium microadriaticum]|uniref:Dynein alpha chain, flagellar outer arm n=1 Tax=Symbiodinium microadriaticum TaxID=2951 RepID=A0A1Q9EUR4_SYMMI|nr:Dynein alpha chain, flagellar outer arm [Symbiodinium microadriaticum]